MDDVMATYFFKPHQGVSKERAAKAICEEETTGTWTDVSTRTNYVKRLDGSVESLTPYRDGFLTTLRYPHEIFEIGNVAQYLSVVAGNLFGLRMIDSVRLLDVSFPDPLVPFKGPKFGIPEIRKIVGTTNRPHVGTIIKPKVGLNPEDTATVAYEAAIGGVDLIKDDETLTNQTFCPLKERVPKVMERLDEVKEKTGREVLYAVNVTTRADQITDRAIEAIDLGANMIMVDVIIAGFAALETLSESPYITVPIHVHRAMHAAMTRNRYHGIAMRPFARLVRLLGGDQLHTGTVSGKMNHDSQEVKGDNGVLRGPYFDKKPTFPVSSGGLHPGKVFGELSILGTDIILQAGGGIHGHPSGTAAGARAMRQAVDAFMEGIPAQEYAKNHSELAEALKKWRED